MSTSNFFVKVVKHNRRMAKLQRFSFNENSIVIEKLPGLSNYAELIAFKLSQKQR